MLVTPVLAANTHRDWSRGRGFQKIIKINFRKLVLCRFEFFVPLAVMETQNAKFLGDEFQNYFLAVCLCLWVCSISGRSVKCV